MIASFAADWLKFRKRPANWILALVLLATLLTFVYIVTYLILSHPPPGFERQGGPPPNVLKRVTFPENLLQEVLQNLAGFGAAIGLIMGALSAGGEYSWSTLQTILVQRPSRLSVLSGKLLVLALAVALLVVATFSAAAVTSRVIVEVDGSTSHWPRLLDIVRAVAAGWVILATWTAFGFTLAVLFRSVAGSLGAGLTYLFVVEGLLGGLFRNVSGLKEILRFLPGINADGLVRAFVTTVPQRGQATPLVGAGRGSITLLVYLVVFIVLSALVIRRRDLG